MKRLLLFALFAAVATSLAADPSLAADAKSLILATTTSTADSGLLDTLNPMFEKTAGYFVKTIAVGSGQAMAMGEKGEADVLLVHSPTAEEKFTAAGFGVNRRLVMHNDFVIVGPPGDPAGIKGLTTAAEALKKISAARSVFMSRGDNSGTHAKEIALWKVAAVSPEGQKWYQQTGLGMGQTLSVSSEKAAYTLADRGTYLALKKNLTLDILVEGEKNLLNIYHVMQVNPEKWPKVNAPGAKAFVEFMVSPDVQKVVSTYGVEKYGSPLFFPDAGKTEDQVGR